MCFVLFFSLLLSIICVRKSKIGEASLTVKRVMNHVTAEEIIDIGTICTQNTLESQPRNTDKGIFIVAQGEEIFVLHKETGYRTIDTVKLSKFIMKNRQSYHYAVTSLFSCQIQTLFRTLWYYKKEGINSRFNATIKKISNKRYIIIFILDIPNQIIHKIILDDEYVFMDETEPAIISMTHNKIKANIFVLQVQFRAQGEKNNNIVDGMAIDTKSGLYYHIQYKDWRGVESDSPLIISPAFNHDKVKDFAFDCHNLGMLKYNIKYHISNNNKYLLAFQDIYTLQVMRFTNNNNDSKIYVDLIDITDIYESHTKLQETPATYMNVLCVEDLDYTIDNKFIFLIPPINHATNFVIGFINMTSWEIYLYNSHNKRNIIKCNNTQLSNKLQKYIKYQYKESDEEPRHSSDSLKINIIDNSNNEIIVGAFVRQSCMKETEETTTPQYITNIIIKYNLEQTAYLYRCYEFDAWSFNVKDLFIY